MFSMRQKSLRATGILLLGLTLGSAVGFLTALYASQQAARFVLRDYSFQLIRQADNAATEFETILHAFDRVGPDFCSDAEIASMRSFMFRSSAVKDIGRLRGLDLVCSAGAGRLPKPVTMPAPLMVSTHGTSVYGFLPLYFAPGQRGIVLSIRSVDIVLAPFLFSSLRRDGLDYMVVMVNASKHQMVRIAGTDIPANPDWVLTQSSRRTHDELLLSRCSAINSVCVVTRESDFLIRNHSRVLVTSLTLFGALVGLGIALAVVFAVTLRRSLPQQLHRAIRKDQLSLVYQPIVDLESERCVGFEALARWRDRDGMPVAPSIFVAIAQERGFIHELTQWVIRRAFAELGDLLHHHPHLQLSINVAPNDLTGSWLADTLDLRAALEDIRPDQIAIEITESTTADLATASHAIQELHDRGYKVHIDDFGTGFSSLSYLHELTVDAIKIDRSFTRTVGTDSVTATILPQILFLAHSLALDVIVEGVETATQVEFLRARNHAMRVQGWHFGRPLPAHLAVRYLHEQDGHFFGAPRPQLVR